MAFPGSPRSHWTPTLNLVGRTASFAGIRTRTKTATVSTPSTASEPRPTALSRRGDIDGLWGGLWEGMDLGGVTGEGWSLGGLRGAWSLGGGSAERDCGEGWLWEEGPWGGRVVGRRVRGEGWPLGGGSVGRGGLWEEDVREGWSLGGSTGRGGLWEGMVLGGSAKRERLCPDSPNPPACAPSLRPLRGSPSPGSSGSPHPLSDPLGHEAGGWGDHELAWPRAAGKGQGRSSRLPRSGRPVPVPGALSVPPWGGDRGTARSPPAPGPARPGRAERSESGAEPLSDVRDGPGRGGLWALPRAERAGSSGLPLPAPDTTGLWPRTGPGHGDRQDPGNGDGSLAVGTVRSLTVGMDPTWMAVGTALHLPGPSCLCPEPRCQPALPAAGQWGSGRAG